MNCHTARESFPELLDRRTAASAHLEARAHLASCPECQRDFAALSQTLSALDAMPTPQPTPRLRQNFYAMLEEEKHSAESVRTVTERKYRAKQASLWRWVLAPLGGFALLAVGFLAGQRTPNPATVEKVTGNNPETAALRAESTAMRSEIKDLNEQVKKMSTLVAFQIMQNPANERLQDVLKIAQAGKADDKTINDLLAALAIDPNTNVRLRALEALLPYAEREVVRSGVLASLPREQNPLVQIELIEFVAAARDRNAAPVLEKMAQDTAIDQTVREAARSAIAQL